MNRILLVSLLKKNIDELILLTEGFEEMSEYPSAMIILAKNKTDDIKSYIDQLGDLQKDPTVTTVSIPTELPTETEKIAGESAGESQTEAMATPTEKEELVVIADEEAEEDTSESIVATTKLTAQPMTRNEAHAKGETTAMNDSIAHKKIDDIRQAISLGDRFRFQRELFKNNGEEMNKMLSYINLLASYDEIVSFLQSKYGWAEDHPVANDFYQIIKRKF